MWNQAYRDYFIDTVLLNLPVPAIFLFESISDEGALSYSVVDGKQRLTTIFDFVDDGFPVSETSKLDRLRGKYFSDFSPADKQELVYTYALPVESLPGTDEGLLDEIFQRINRNVSRLSHQELRHARFYGVFARAAEELATEIFEELPERFPNIAVSSVRQMKDVEFTALLLLLVQHGPESTPQAYLDEIYAERDSEWDDRVKTSKELRRVIRLVNRIAVAGGAPLQSSRLRNQGDFYALVGAVAQIPAKQIDPQTAADRLLTFVSIVADDEARESDPMASSYMEAARSAANDPGQRSARIEILKSIILQG